MLLYFVMLHYLKLFYIMLSHLCDVMFYYFYVITIICNYTVLC